MLMPWSDAVRAQPAGHLPAIHGNATVLAVRELYCRTAPTACAFGVDEPMNVILALQLRRLETAVNRQVNAMIQPRSDRELWKVEGRAGAAP